LPFCQTTLTAKKSPDRRYPRELVTLGDHIRKRRLDLGLSQGAVAAVLGAALSSVTGWEINRCGPRLSLFPKITEFLGYSPLSGQNHDESFGGQLRARRRRLGISQKQLAGLLGVDQTTVSNWERGVNEPRAGFKVRIVDILGSGKFDIQES